MCLAASRLPAYTFAIARLQPIYAETYHESALAVLYCCSSASDLSYAAFGVAPATHRAHQHNLQTYQHPSGSSYACSRLCQEKQHKVEGKLPYEAKEPPLISDLQMARELDC
jgi:hypothetical protein